MDILPNKFGEFLVLLAGGIMMTACKKEEKAMLNLQNEHLKTTKVSNLSSYILVNSYTIVDGVLSDEYRNLYSGSSLFIEKEIVKSIFRRYKWDAYLYNNQDGTKTLMCGGEPLQECYNTPTGIHVKYGASLE